MSLLPIPSLSALLQKAEQVVNTSKQSLQNAAHNQHSGIGGYSAKDGYQQHILHYLLKGLSQLPSPVLERINTYMQAHDPDKYPHADAHMRLIIALNNKMKRPLTLDNLLKLRKQYAINAVSMQSLKVWQQPDISSSNDALSSSAPSESDIAKAVSWQDKIIANADNEDMTIRCYQRHGESQSEENSAAKATDETVMLFFHGGGFCIGDLDTHHEFCHSVCAQTGWAVVSVDYRLAPEHPAPAALQDSLAAYAWLAEHAHSLGAEPSRIVLSGDSAGGCLAILVAQQVLKPDVELWQGLGKDETADEAFIALLQDLPKPLAQLPLYPVTDIEAEHPSWGLYGQGLLLDHADVEVFDAAYMQQSALPQSHPLVSPMHGDNEQMCPSYIISAELDILRDEALAYSEQLKGYDVKVQSHTVLGAPHGFIHLMSVHQGVERETKEIIANFASFIKDL